MLNNQIDLEAPLFIDTSFSLLTALTRMDSLKRKLLIVMKENKFLNVLSVGDIQRAIINKYPLDQSIAPILRTEITVCNVHDSMDSIKQKMLEFRTECMPILGDNNDLINVLFWEEIYGELSVKKKVALKLPVVIMAGGKGTRLKPLTNIFPKPLLPINEKTIIEDIMDRFVDAGCNEFYLSVNYKAETIKNYFNVLHITNALN